MSNVIKKIFEGNCDEEVHGAFIKFSRGRFENKYLLEGKKRGKGWSVKTSAEFVNTIVRQCLEGVEGELDITGVIVCTMDLRNEVSFEFERVKQFRGIKQLVINGKINASELRELMEKQPRAFYALTFETDKFKLKTKAKAPKGAKPSNKGDKEVKANFCALKTNDAELIKDLFFDLGEFKEAKINHTIEINDIELPVGVDDPVQLREQAKRKGKVIRKIKVDGSEKVSEKDFVA